MKKFFALLLSLAMVLALVACGQKDPTPDTPDTPDDPQTKVEYKVAMITDYGGTRWRKYSAVPMHRISGRQFRFGIRNMPHTTISCMPYWEEQTNVKSQIDGNKE